MMRAARTKPIHGENQSFRFMFLKMLKSPFLKHTAGVLKALQRCLFEGPVSVCDAADHSLISEVLSLLESISLLLLGVLHGDNKDSFTEKGNTFICKLY